MINKEEWFGTELELEVECQHNSLILKHPEIRDDLGSTHPDAQWFRTAGLGLFLHWGISAVDGRIDLSWGMLSTGLSYPRGTTEEEIRRREEESGRQLPGSSLRPSRYFALAQGFTADRYDPDAWMRLAREAGFQYAVLTAKHCDGFMLWPSEYGEFSTKKYLGGRDLVGEFVEACRGHGLKVGLYFTPTDWYFNRRHMSFMSCFAKRKNPSLPDVDENFVVEEMPSAEQMARQVKLHGVQHRGQLHELLSRYGKIDVLWFDGGAPKGEVYPLRDIYRIQPGAVATTRMHGYGDFKNCEVTFAEQKPKGWWEYCTIWSKRRAWGYTNDPEYRPTAEVIAELVKTRNWGGNYLLNIGPMANGEFPEPALRGLKELAAWTRKYGESVLHTAALPEGESANVHATAQGNVRYLFIPSGFAGTVELTGISGARSVVSLGDGRRVPHTFAGRRLAFDPGQTGAADSMGVVKVAL